MTTKYKKIKEKLRKEEPERQRILSEKKKAKGKKRRVKDIKIFLKKKKSVDITVNDKEPF